MHPMLRHPLRFRRDHRFSVEHSSDYFDGDLDETERVRLEHHARFCPKCHELLASLRGTISALRALGAPPRDPRRPDIAAGVIARLRADG